MNEIYFILPKKKKNTTKLILQVSRCLGKLTPLKIRPYIIVSYLALLIFAIILLTLMAPGLHQLFLNKMEKCRTKK